LHEDDPAYDDGIDRECMPVACVSKSRSEEINMVRQEL
jgi:hypothetical protein